MSLTIGGPNSKFAAFCVIGEKNDPAAIAAQNHLKNGGSVQVVAQHAVGFISSAAAAKMMQQQQSSEIKTINLPNKTN